MASGDKTKLGRRGEAIAALALQRLVGVEILERNWRCDCGEVDLVAAKGEHIYFVEVRTRRATSDFSPEMSITHRKAERMDRVARTYLGAHPSVCRPIWHVSLMAVTTNPKGELQRMTFYPSLEAEPVELLSSHEADSEGPPQ
jgi:putative endonuclease